MEPEPELPMPVVAGRLKSRSGAARNLLDKQMRKTRLCHFYLKGACKNGFKCSFAHESQELQHAPDLRKTRLCKAFVLGECRDEGCKFAHGNEELRATDCYFKTTLCSWNEKGKCINGARCRFAHGDQELRITGDKTEQAGPAESAAYDVSQMLPWQDLSAIPMKVQPKVTSQSQRGVIGQQRRGPVVAPEEYIFGSAPNKVGANVLRDNFPNGTRSANMQLLGIPHLASDGEKELCSSLLHSLATLSVQLRSLEQRIASRGTQEAEDSLPPAQPMLQPYYGAEVIGFAV